MRTPSQIIDFTIGFTMEWKHDSDPLSGDDRYISNTDRGWYDIVYLQYSKKGWYIVYTPPKSLGGYLSDRLHMHCITSRIDSLPDDCFFKMPEEAKAVCERHYELLILQ